MQISYDSTTDQLSLNDGQRTATFSPPVIIDMFSLPAGTVIVFCGKDEHGAIGWKYYNAPTVQAIAAAGQEVK